MSNLNFKKWTEWIVTLLSAFIYNILDAFKQPFTKMLIQQNFSLLLHKGLLLCLYLQYNDVFKNM